MGSRLPPLRPTTLGRNIGGNQSKNTVSNKLAVESETHRTASLSQSPQVPRGDNKFIRRESGSSFVEQVSVQTTPASYSKSNRQEFFISSTVAAPEEALFEGVKNLSSDDETNFKQKLMMQTESIRASLPQELAMLGNLAYAEIEVPGLPTSMKAYSKFQRGEDGFVPMPKGQTVLQADVAAPWNSLPSDYTDSENVGNARQAAINENLQIFQSIEKMWGNDTRAISRLHLYAGSNSIFDRGVDSEFKILESIARSLVDRAEVIGTIFLFTEQAPCKSCIKVISEFRQLFPGIQLNLLSGR